MKAEDFGWKLKMDPAKAKDQAGQGDKLIPAASIEINVVKFLESRSREMEAMRQSAALVSTNARVMQQLPCHMRRRAASHNVKRLPRHLRLEAEKELKKSGGSAAPKRPSRRHRRRPRCLLEEFERRKRKHVWLETHIWHAKRFHMAEMWGYKVPLHLNDRGIRAAYRDTVNRCLLFDLSYYCCIEVSGNRETLLTTLLRFTSPDIAPSFASQKYARGTREGRTTLYRHGSYPFHALGEVRFLWKARPNSSDASGNLWIWTHPSAHEIIFTELKTAFQMVENIGDGREVAATIVTSLKDELCRFRLVGPQSQQILRRVFLPARFSDSGPAGNRDVPRWWNLTGDHGLFERQAEAWKRMESLHCASDLLPNSIYSLVVRDPRVAGQSKKQTVLESRCVKQQSGNLESWISASPLWDRGVRESVKDSMMKTAEINSLKSNNLVPGSPLELGSKESRIPVLFIQNPGASGTDAPTRLGYGCGWDVVLPGGWSLPFWVELGHCGAHAAGLEELRHVDFEQSELHFPDHFPDTPSGANVNLSCYVKAVEKYNRIPPAKRINYKKLKVETPFHFPWKELVDGWRKTPGFSNVNEITNGFCCLRNRRFLQLLQKLVNGYSQLLGKRRFPENGAALEAASQQLQVIRHDPYLVPVHLVMSSRGVCGKFSMICIPEDDDVAQYTKSPKEPGLVNERGCKRTKNTTKSNKRKKQEEPCVAEPMSKKSRLELDDIATSGSTDGRLGNDVENISSSGISLECSAVLLEQASNLPDKVNKDVEKSLPFVGDVVNSCSKKVLGYVVTDSGLAYTKGLGAAFGFVSLQGLLSLIEIQKTYVHGNANDEKANSSVGNSASNGVLVLVRSTRCEHYRFARLNILQKI